MNKLANQNSPPLTETEISKIYKNIFLAADNPHYFRRKKRAIFPAYFEEDIQEKSDSEHAYISKYYGQYSRYRNAEYDDN